ncbi:hypothetical protein ACW4TU_42410 [Streptomyces sp. QTS52]
MCTPWKSLREGVDLVEAAERLRLVVDRVLPCPSALEPQNALATGRHLGKIVLKVG